MYKIFTIFIAVIVTSCLAQRPLRFRNKRIPYEDDDYRDSNGNYDDDRPNEINNNKNIRPYEHYGGNRYNHMPDMNRQTQFDIGGGRDPPIDFSLRGYGQQPRPLLHQLQQQQQSQQSQIQPQPQPQPQAQNQLQQLGYGYNGGRAGAFGYTPYGNYGYLPYGYRPAYGWNRPAQTADPWRGNSFGLGFPFNLFGLGGNSRPWWNPYRSFGFF